jgi:hypothetical protein
MIIIFFCIIELNLLKMKDQSKKNTINDRERIKNVLFGESSI